MTKGLLILLIALEFVSCKKTTTDTNSTPPIIYPPVPQLPHDIYLAGNAYTKNRPGGSIAAFWKNGAITFLDAGFSTASAIYVSGIDIYVVGSTYFIGSQNLRHSSYKYWKNGVSYNLPSQYANGSTYLTCIFVSGTDVYIGGSDNGRATIWKNGIPVNLAKSPNESSSVLALYISGNDVYGAGIVATTYPNPNNFSGTYATYWKNGVATRLEDQYNSQALSIFVSGNDVYIGGFDDANPGGIAGHQNAATYWKNGLATRLDTVRSSQVNALYAANGELYVVSDFGTFWKNGVMRNLNDAPYINSGYGSSITVSGEEVFIGGSMNSKVAYWRSNVAVKMEEDGIANSIFVVKK